MSKFYRKRGAGGSHGKNSRRSARSAFLANNILRLILQFSLLLLFGKYLEDVISFPFLILSFLIMTGLTILFYNLNFRSLPAVLLLFVFPWLIRIIFILINFYDQSFLQISFDMNFYLFLFPLYITTFFTWTTLVKPDFRKYEVLLNGIFLYLLFWKQGNYQITLVPNPAYLALFAFVFILLELLVLYLSITLERGLKRNFVSSIREFILFFLLLVPLIVYLLLPLWRVYEEGSVAGGGGLLKSSMFRFDFSEYIKLETEISMSDDLVMMYRKEGPAERMLLRRYVLSGYEQGQGFYRHERDKTNPPDKLLPRYTEYENPQYESREKVSQEMFLVNIDPTAFLSLNYPVNSQPIYNWDNSSFVRIYQSEAMVSTRTIRVIDPLISMEDDIFEHYTSTGSDETIRQLAVEITEDTSGSLLKTMEIENYFHNNYFYSLKPGVAPDGDQLSYFINESHKGYCSYFAFSMALMCRSLGIPARVAVGFWVDPDVSVLNFYPVRADQAHAWVEVYFNNYGWIEFDPTSSTMFPGEQYPFASFTIDEFSPLIEEILDNELIAENLSDLGNDTGGEQNPASILSSIIRLAARRWYVFLLIFYVVYIVVYRFTYIIFAFFSRTERGKAKYYYLYVRSKLSFDRKKFGESIADYAVRVERRLNIPFIQMTELYQKSVFSPVFTSDDLAAFLETIDETIGSYRMEISRWKRILFFLVPLIRSIQK